MAQLLVNIDVDNLERGIAFYTRAFGVSVGRKFGADAVELVGLGAPVYLLVKPAGTHPLPAENKSARRDYGRHWTPVHLDLVVDDLEAAMKRAEDAGARAEGQIEAARWGRMVNMADPFGHGFCLLQFSGRGYDEIAKP